MGYNSESIYRVYFPDSLRIETVRDLEFDEYDSYQAMQMMEDTEQLFSFPDLEPVSDKTNALPIREIREASLLPTSERYVIGIVHRKRNSSDRRVMMTSHQNCTFGKSYVSLAKIGVASKGSTQEGCAPETSEEILSLYQG